MRNGAPPLSARHNNERSRCAWHLGPVLLTLLVVTTSVATYGAQLSTENTFTATLLFVGDVLPARGVTLENAPLADVAPWLAEADLAIGNLEGTIALTGTARPGPYRFRAEPGAALVLAEAGFDLLSLANNHALDYGPAALSETVAHLEAAGITPLGLKRENPVVANVNGLRLAFLSYNAIVDPEDTPPSSLQSPLSTLDPLTLPAEIADTRAGTEADALILILHWGEEYQPWPTPTQERLARLALAAGADLVVGAHPHVAQPVAQGSRGLIAYSLGNFLFDSPQPEARRGLALSATFTREGLEAAELLAVEADATPRLLPADQAGDWLAQFEPVALAPQPLAFTFAGDDAYLPVSVHSQIAAAPFTSGEIDMTGDGRPEIVSLVEGRLHVESKGALVWQSEPDWVVQDVALGDPNNDGRFEALVAFWKPDEAGQMRSQPFVIGYRRGLFDTCWGGSPVTYPLFEVALADVDGDSYQELLALEGRSEDMQGVTVWRWHGWGFSQQWGSVSGAYRGLSAQDVSGDGVPDLILAGAW